MPKILNISLSSIVRENIKENVGILKHGDSLILKIKVLDSDGKVMDLTDKTVKLVLRKQDSTVYENTITDITDISVTTTGYQPTTYTGSLITATLEEEGTNVVGTVKGEILITDISGTIITNTFTLLVIPSLTDGVVISGSENEIQTLIELINTIQEYEELATAIAGTITPIEALTEIKSYIDTNLPDLESNNAEAVVNNNNLQNSITESQTSKSALDASIEEANNFVATYPDASELIATVADHTTQLSHIVSQSNQNIGVKKDVSFNTFWTSSTSPILDVNIVKNQIDEMFPLCDNIVHAQYCYYDNTAHTAHHRGSIDVVKEGIEYAIAKDMNFKCLKFHLKLSDIINDLGIDGAVTTYYNFVNNYMSNFQQKPEYITILNEDYTAYTNTSYTIGIVSLLTQIKSLGYKVGITIRNAYELFSLSQDIINASDDLFVNLYPVYSINSTSSTITECQCGLDQYLNFFKYLKNKYNKKIIISEIGCNNSWDSLINPSAYNTNNISTIPPYIVLKALLNSDLINLCSEFWLWFYVDIKNSNEASSLLKSYKISGNLRG